MTRVKRVVDARRTQGRLIYHLQCGHAFDSVEPILVDAIDTPRELAVDDKLACRMENCDSNHMPEVPEHPRFAEHWSRCFAALVSGRLAQPDAHADLGLVVDAQDFADLALAIYRKRFP